MDQTVGIGEAAQAAGVSVHALRYYESEGLMVSPIARDHRGRRRYTQDDVHWVGALTRLRATGMPIAVMKEYARATRAGDDDERVRLLAEHRQIVANHIAMMSEYLAAIDDKVNRLRMPDAADAASSSPERQGSAGSRV